MTLPSVAEHQLDLAQASYARCQLAPDFFRAFYNRLLASDPAIPPYFAHTRFDKQEKLLQHGISLLLIFARRPNPNLLERITERHGSAGLNVPYRLYPVFLQSFLDTVREYDPAFDAGHDAAWRAALAPGISVMRGNPA
ncbi:MAG: globin domain-containing protein [Gemmatimonadota bacterium]